MASPDASHSANGNFKSDDKESTLRQRLPQEGGEDRGGAVIWPDNQNVTRDAIVKFGKDFKAGLRRVRETYTPFDYLAAALPCLHWLRSYRPRKYLLWDLAAGASVAALVVPQGMAYARLAGLPQEYGLYGAFVPVVAYAALGSSRHLSVGPVVITSLIFGSSLPPIVAKSVPGFRLEGNPNRPLNPEGQAEFNRAAVQVAFLAGLLYTAVGVFRLSFFINFLSASVINGFMTGAAVTIMTSQFRNAFGYDTIPNPKWTPASPKSVQRYTPYPRFKGDDRIIEQAKLLFSKQWLATFKWRDFVMYLSWLLILIVMKEIGKRSKKFVWVKALGPLTVLVFSTSLVVGARLGCDPAKRNPNPLCVRIVGPIPKGLPRETVSWWVPMSHFREKLGVAALVCAIDLMESVSIAKAIAFKNRYVLQNTQELVGLGVANVVGAAFSCYTTTGSFGRSAIMDNVGAKTQVAGWVGALLVMFVLLFLTPLLQSTPLNAPAAILTSVFLGLLQFGEWWFLWKTNKLDFLVFSAGVLGVVFAGVELGLALAIGLSIVLALAKSAFPHTAVLGKLPGTTGVYRSVAQYASAQKVPGLLLVRIDAPLFFANVTPVADALERLEREERAAARKARGLVDANGGSGSEIDGEDDFDDSIKAVVLDLSPVTDFDASAAHWFRSYVRATRARGVDVALANPSTRVAGLLARAGLDAVVGRDRVFARVGDAVEALRDAPRLAVTVVREGDDYGDGDYEGGKKKKGDKKEGKDAPATAAAASLRKDDSAGPETQPPPPPKGGA